MAFVSKPNVTTNFLPDQGLNKSWIMKKLPVAASVAIAEGAAVYWQGSGAGTVTKVTNATANFAGILAETIAATDTDYATAGKLKAVWVPTNTSAEAFFTVGAGTFTAADVGESVKFYDEVSVDADTGGTQVRITGYISSTKGKCIFNQAIS